MNYPQMMQNPYNFIPQNPYMTPASQEMVQRFNGYQAPMQPQPQQYQQPQPVQQGPAIKASLVTSAVEAQSANVLDGSRYLFVDTAEDVIYSRQMDFSTGKAEPIAYVRKDPPKPTELAPQQPQPVDEVSALKDKLNALEAKYTALEERVNESTSNRQHDGTAEPASKGDDAAGSTDAATGNEPGRNNKSSATAKSK